jgi:hypothetical protein
MSRKKRNRITSTNTIPSDGDAYLSSSTSSSTASSASNSSSSSLSSSTHPRSPRTSPTTLINDGKDNSNPQTQHEGLRRRPSNPDPKPAPNPNKKKTTKLRASKSRAAAAAARVSQLEFFADDPWNAMLVLGLRVYSKGDVRVGVGVRK